MTAPTPLLEVDRLEVRAGGRSLHPGFSLRLAPGETVVLTAPSGRGKSTLLRALVGLEPRTSGRVLVEGRSGDDWGWPQLRRRLGWVPQVPSMLAASVEENLRLAWIAAPPEQPAFDPGAARAGLDSLGLAEVSLEQAAPTLSGGQAQRLALLRAMLAGPRVLLLDEPTSGLDAASSGQVEAALRGWVAAGSRALLVASHAAGLAEALGARSCAFEEEP